MFIGYHFWTFSYPWHSFATSQFVHSCTCWSRSHTSFRTALGVDNHPVSFWLSWPCLLLHWGASERTFDSHRKSQCRDASTKPPCIILNEYHLPSRSLRISFVPSHERTFWGPMRCWWRCFVHPTFDSRGWILCSEPWSPTWHMVMLLYSLRQINLYLEIGGQWVLSTKCIHWYDGGTLNEAAWGYYNFFVL